MVLPFLFFLPELPFNHSIFTYIYSLGHGKPQPPQKTIPLGARWNPCMWGAPSVLFKYNHHTCRLFFFAYICLYPLSPTIYIYIYIYIFEEKENLFWFWSGHLELAKVFLWGQKRLNWILSYIILYDSVISEIKKNDNFVLLKKV